MNENIYYLSMQSTSLSHYFGKALILPSRFYKNRPSDIQNINSDYLVLSKNKFLNNSNCSIKLILTNEDITSLAELEDSNVFLYSKPIPISRIKKVYFLNEEQKKKTIDNINRGTAFISENFIEIIEEASINVNTSNDYNNKYSSELESKIKTYNEMLGGLAFVRYTLEGEYTENYFSILSHFNNFIGIQIENRYDKYDGAFTHNGDFWSKLSPLLYENISEEDVSNFSKQEKVDIEKSNGIFKYEIIDSKTITYKLAILSTYGENSSKRKKTNDLISDFKNGKIPKEKQEGIALIYGINNGYSNFRNQYDKKIVKFKMDSLLDYYTIESVFQYVINDKKDNEKFEYIDEIFPDEELVLNILHNEKEESFDLEQHLKDILNYFQKNSFSLSPKELINYIVNKFKNIFLEEISKKNTKISSLTQNLNNKKGEIKELNKDTEEKNKKIDSLKEIIETKNHELQEVNNKYESSKKELEEKDISINHLNKNIRNQENNFDEEKERIIIEQTFLESYLKYDSKKVPELKKIAKEKGIKYTNKPDTIKLILSHNNNRLL